MKAPSEDPHGHEAQAIEAAALRELHEAADGTLRDRLGLYRHEGGGTLVSVAAGDPSILINRTTGLGVSWLATRQQVDEIVSCYRDAGVARFFVQRHPQALPPTHRTLAPSSRTVSVCAPNPPCSWPGSSAVRAGTRSWSEWTARSPG